ncbi:MAG: hypothetical protein AAF735_03715 [Myxococcota bacterium]
MKTAASERETIETLNGETGLAGSWVLVRDDESSDPAEETLYLSSDGRCVVTGDYGPLHGIYIVDGSELQLVVLRNGSEVKAAPWGFELSHDKLRLANPGRGFAHYKRAELPMPPAPAWKSETYDDVSFEMPPQWLVRNEPRDESGTRRLLLQNPNETKVLSVVRTPIPMDSTFEGYAVSLLELFSSRFPAKWRMQRVEQESLFHLSGIVFRGHGTRAIATLLDESHVVILVAIAEQDRLSEFDRIVASIRWID